MKVWKWFATLALCATLIGGTALAANTAYKNITIWYSGIKLVIDGVEVTPKDANGTTVEPFIYNGTTYLPVRAVGNAIGKQVTWDGESRTVYLGEAPGSKTWLMEACPPYEGNYMSYLQNDGKSFEMAGEKYSNGIVLARSQTYVGSALFNLNGRYSILECTVGHVNNSNYDQSVSFIVDGKLVEEILVKAGEMPQKVSIPLNKGLQLKIIRDDGRTYQYIGLGNIVIK